MCYALEMSGEKKGHACCPNERDSETRIESGGGKVSFRFLAWCLFEKDLDAGNSGVRNSILIHPQTSKYP